VEERKRGREEERKRGREKERERGREEGEEESPCSHQSDDFQAFSINDFVFLSSTRDRCVRPLPFQNMKK
jgi:hypothetical protein